MILLFTEITEQVNSLFFLLPLFSLLFSRCLSICWRIFQGNDFCQGNDPCLRSCFSLRSFKINRFIILKSITLIRPSRFEFILFTISNRSRTFWFFKNNFPTIWFSDFNLLTLQVCWYYLNRLLTLCVSVFKSWSSGFKTKAKLHMTFGLFVE